MSPGKAAPVIQDVEYGTVHGHSLRLDVHVPVGTGPLPVALVLHGGGWSSGDKAGDVMPIIEALTAGGVICFSADYRLAPQYQWPACYDDVELALAWVRGHAAEFGGDAARLAVVGYSAGGHLACRVAVRAPEGQVQAVVVVAGPTDIVADMRRRGGLSPSMQNLLGRESLDDDLWPQLAEMSPLNDIRSGLPPFLFVHGTEDKSVPYEQSVNFLERLRAVGGTGELITLQGAGHGLAHWGATAPGFMDELVMWVKRTLNGTRTGAA